MADGGEVPERYVQVDAFDVPEVAAADGGDGVVTIANADGRVDLITASDRRRLARREAIVDVAVAGRVYVLTDTELEAFSHEGSRVWGLDVDDGRSVDADSVGDHVYVRTGDGKFVAVEGRTGIESGRFDQPHAEVAESPAVAAYDGRVAVASWSFLTVLDSTGDLLAECTLSGAVTDVGLLSDRAVVSLKDGQLVGYDGEDSVWALDGDVSWLADSGNVALAGRMSGNDFAIDADGDRHTLTGVSGTPVAATDSLDVLCFVGSGTVTVYAAVGSATESVSVDVPTETVSPADATVTVAFTNEGDRAVEADATVEAKGASVATESVRATVEAGATVHRRVPLQSLDGEEVTLTVTVGDDTATSTVDVREERTALSVETDLDQVDAGTLSATVEVSNDGEATLTGVSVGETSVGRLSPGDAETVQIEQDLPSGPVRVDADDVDPLDADTEVPATPTDIDLTAESDGFLLVTLANETPVAVDDEVTVTGVPDEDGSTTFPVSIPARGVYRIAIPVVTPGERSATVETAGGRVSERLSLSRCSLLDDDTAGGASPRRGATSTGRRGAPNGANAAVSGGGSPSTGPGGTNASDTVPLSLDRRLPDGVAERGTVFREQLVVSNESADPITFDLVTDEGAYTQRLSVRGGSEAIGTRYHVPFADTVTLPDVVLESDRGSVSVSPDSHRIDDGTLVTKLTWRSDDGAGSGGVLSVDLESDVGDWLVQDVVLGNDRSVTLDAEVTPDQPAHVTVTTPYTLDDDVGKAFVRAERTDVGGASTQQFNTLVAHESLVDGDVSGIGDLSVELAPESRVQHGLGSVYVVVRNDGSQPVDGVSISASGTHVEKTMYAEGSDGGTLAPDDTCRYLVDLEDVGGDDHVDVAVDLTASGGGPREATVTATADADGSVASDAWELDVEDVAGGFPERLSTSYE